MSTPPCEHHCPCVAGMRQALERQHDHLHAQEYRHKQRVDNLIKEKRRDEQRRRDMKKRHSVQRELLVTEVLRLRRTDQLPLQTVVDDD